MIPIGTVLRRTRGR